MLLKEYLTCEGGGIGDKQASQALKALLSLKRSWLKSPQKCFAKGKERISLFSLVNCWGRDLSYTLFPSIDRQAADRDASESEGKGRPQALSLVKNWGDLNFSRKAHHSERKSRDGQKEEKHYWANFNDDYKENKARIIFLLFLVTLYKMFGIICN